MKVGIIGCAGRMGQMLVQEVLQTEGCELSGGVEEPGNTALGEDVAGYCGFSESGIVISDNPGALFEISDVIIDFSLPTATAKHMELAEIYGISLILGTTGHDDSDFSLIEKAAEKIVIVKAMNFSIGVNVILALTEKISGLLNEDYDIEVFEMHHKHKIDSPSGTAIALGEAAARGRSIQLDDVSIKGRRGITGTRKKGAIGFSSLRGGEVVGDHSIIFAGESERVELSHKADSRRIFSKGAVLAAQWATGQKPGLYSMLDVLGLKKDS